ncbi:MAG: hypothetical protein GYB65_02095 [Chloroflexi bacterium]|nr:hypothetical protein [Chloroflexota bacterium]
MAHRNNHFNWHVLQTGSLPLRPDGMIHHRWDHRCTSVLIWPYGERIARDNAVLTDPCFTDAGYSDAAVELKELGVYFEDIGYVFVTHLHADHMLHLPYDVPAPRFRPLRPGEVEPLAGLTTVPVPGHHALQLALMFTAPDERAIWVVGDGVLDEEWLRAWGFYWPNGYTQSEIVETWFSVARILGGADVVVPGHGAPIVITAELVRDLLATFPQAPHAELCPEVADALRARLAGLEGA